MRTVTSLVVDELKDLKLDVSITGTSVKVALECMSCDILVARKMGDLLHTHPLMGGLIVSRFFHAVKP